MSKLKKEKLVKLRARLLQCRKQIPMHGGRTPADYDFRRWVYDAGGLILDSLDMVLELAEE